MKLYDAAGPHPDVVRMVLAEKGLEIASEVLALGIGDARRPSHLARNPLGQAPVLELDDGRCIAETAAICEYLEELHPSPPLIGSTPVERAETRMWARRVELHICLPLYYGFSFGPPAPIRERERFGFPRSSPEFRTIARANLNWLEEQLRSRAYLCAGRFSLADIYLYCFLSFGIVTGQPMRPEWPALSRWRERVASRPSVARSTLQVDPMSLSAAV